jgi:hypothetical protein
VVYVGEFNSEVQHPLKIWPPQSWSSLFDDPGQATTILTLGAGPNHSSEDWAQPTKPMPFYRLYHARSLTQTSPQPPVAKMLATAPDLRLSLCRWAG